MASKIFKTLRHSKHYNCKEIRRNVQASFRQSISTRKTISFVTSIEHLVYFNKGSTEEMYRWLKKKGARTRVVGAAIHFSSIERSILHPLVTSGGSKRLYFFAVLFAIFCSHSADILRPPDPLMSSIVCYPLIFCITIEPLILHSIK